MAAVGRIHSRESFGTVDGPGIRYVLFMQGCPMRCLFCHNPDTWDPAGGVEITAEEVMAEYRKNSAFYTHGGITVTGGEPLLQTEFVTELFTLAKSEGVHTCIDTSGITFDPDSESCISRFDRLMELVDLVLLDIKHIDSDAHRRLTAHGNERILAFARYLEAHDVPVWIRHIIVEGISDEPDALRRLGRFIGTLKNLRALDVLPYHTMGVGKYRELGIPYPLEGLPALPISEAVKAKRFILEGVKESRK